MNRIFEIIASRPTTVFVATVVPTSPFLVVHVAILDVPLAVGTTSYLENPPKTAEKFEETQKSGLADLGF